MKNFKIILFIAAGLLICGFLWGQGDPPEIHCKHFFLGYPTGTPATNDLIIREIYALSNNDETKFADWVAYRLTTDEITPVHATSRYWRADHWLEDRETLEPRPSDDYGDANARLGTERGHLAPLASFKGSEHWRDTNYLSNICPQTRNLNNGLWKDIEELVRDYVEEDHEVIVYCGPLYEEHFAELPNADEPHTIPSGFWKIIFFDVDQGSFQTAAFILNQDTPQNAELRSYITTIKAIEDRSGLDFLGELSTDQQNSIETIENRDWIVNNFLN